MRRESSAGGISERRRPVKMSARLIAVSDFWAERRGARVDAAAGPRVLPFREMDVMLVEDCRGDRCGRMSAAVVSFREREEREKVVLSLVEEVVGEAMVASVRLLLRGDVWL